MFISGLGALHHQLHFSVEMFRSPITFMEFPVYKCNAWIRRHFIDNEILYKLKNNFRFVHAIVPPSTYRAITIMGRPRTLRSCSDPYTFSWRMANLTNSLWAKQLPKRASRTLRKIKFIVNHVLLSLFLYQGTNMLVQIGIIWNVTE